MFKARLRETLEAFLVAYDDGPTSAEEVIEQALSEIIELVKEIVPEEEKGCYDHLDKPEYGCSARCFGAIYFNTCRQAILANLGEDK